MPKTKQPTTLPNLDITVELRKIGQRTRATVSARQLHTALAIETPFHVWIRRQIADTAILVDVDFVPASSMTLCGLRADTTITVEAAQKIIRIAQPIHAKALLRHLNDSPIAMPAETKPAPASVDPKDLPMFPPVHTVAFKGKNLLGVSLVDLHRCLGVHQTFDAWHLQRAREFGLVENQHYWIDTTIDDHGAETLVTPIEIAKRLAPRKATSPASRSGPGSSTRNACTTRPRCCRTRRPRTPQGPP